MTLLFAIITNNASFRYWYIKSYLPLSCGYLSYECAYIYNIISYYSVRVLLYRDKNVCLRIYTYNYIIIILLRNSGAAAW